MTHDFAGDNAESTRGVGVSVQTIERPSEVSIVHSSVNSTNTASMGSWDQTVRPRDPRAPSTAHIASLPAYVQPQRVRAMGAAKTTFVFAVAGCLANIDDPRMTSKGETFNRRTRAEKRIQDEDISLFG